MNLKFFGVYLGIIAVIIASLLIFPISDSGQMILFALMIVLTSIYTYSTRRKS